MSVMERAFDDWCTLPVRDFAVITAEAEARQPKESSDTVSIYLAPDVLQALLANEKLRSSFLGRDYAEQLLEQSATTSILMVAYRSTIAVIIADRFSVTVPCVDVDTVMSEWEANHYPYPLKLQGGHLTVDLRAMSDQLKRASRDH